MHQTSQFLMCLYIAMGNYNGSRQHRTILHMSTDEHPANRHACAIKRTKEPCITFCVAIASFCVKISRLTAGESSLSTPYIDYCHLTGRSTLGNGARGDRFPIARPMCFLFRVHATNKLALFTDCHNSGRNT